MTYELCLGNNLHAANFSPPPEWRMRIEALGLNDRRAAYHADIFCGNQWMCRVVLAGTFADQSSAVCKLAARARIWLIDYCARPPAGDEERSNTEILDRLAGGDDL